MAPTFREAAIKILKDKNKPLRLKDLTKLAVETANLKTSGATPQNTMSTTINRDIRKNGASSAFKFLEKGLYILNPSYLEFYLRAEKSNTGNRGS